jgi:hypothetical protein
MQHPKTALPCCLRFTYEHGMNAVFAQADAADVDALLSTLYQDDSGEQFPHNSCEALLNSGRVDASALPHVQGKPYKCVPMLPSLLVVVLLWLAGAPYVVLLLILGTVAAGGVSTWRAWMSILVQMQPNRLPMIALVHFRLVKCSGAVSGGLSVF